MIKKTAFPLIGVILGFIIAYLLFAILGSFVEWTKDYWNIANWHPFDRVFFAAAAIIAMSFGGFIGSLIAEHNIST